MDVRSAINKYKKNMPALQTCKGTGREYTASGGKKTAENARARSPMWKKFTYMKNHSTFKCINL